MDFKNICISQLNTQYTACVQLTYIEYMNFTIYKYIMSLSVLCYVQHWFASSVQTTSTLLLHAIFKYIMKIGMKRRCRFTLWHYVANGCLFQSPYKDMTGLLLCTGCFTCRWRSDIRCCSDSLITVIISSLFKLELHVWWTDNFPPQSENLMF